MIKAEYTRGNIAAMMLKTAAAMLASTLAMSGYNLADTFFVGHLGGTAPLAAMGFTFPIIMLAGCLVGGFGGGCMALMAHAIGEGDHDGARRIVSAGMLLISIISATIAILGTCFAQPVYRVLGAQGETLRQLEGYMGIWFLGCITVGLSMPGNHLLIAAGRPNIASAMTILGMCVNVLLDPVMIFGGAGFRVRLLAHTPSWLHGALAPLLRLLEPMPAMGIRGAALATILSQCVSMVIILHILRRVDLLSFRRIPLPLLFGTWRDIAGYALPSILGMMLIPITNNITTWVTAKFGDTMVAAVAAASKIEHVTFVLPMAFGIPLMSIIAQNYGAKYYNRVKFAYNFASAIAGGFLVVMAVVLFFAAPAIVPFFTPVVEIQRLMVRYLRITAWGYSLLELTRYAGFALTGTGHPRIDAALKAFRLLLLLTPLSLLAYALHWQDGVFYARLVSDALGGAICFTIAFLMLRRLREAPPVS